MVQCVHIRMFCWLPACLISSRCVQATVRQHFRGVTILTIAHRLPTIIDYDKLLVMDDGRVVETGSPSELLSQAGVFASMVNSTGPEAAAFLRSAAK